ncbi:MAG: hypothetical protein ACRC5A_07120 [Enterobacteriaceae bacterium]
MFAPAVRPEFTQQRRFCLFLLSISELRFPFAAAVARSPVPRLNRYFSALPSVRLGNRVRPPTPETGALSPHKHYIWYAGQRRPILYVVVLPAGALPRR